MPIYYFEGEYAFRGNEHPFSGDLSVEEGKVSGIVKEPASWFDEYTIEGRTEAEKGKTVLIFTKRPNSESDLALLSVPVEYVMSRQGTTEDLSGVYEGGWRFLDEERPIGDIGIDYKPGIGEAVYITILKEMGNKARMRLSISNR